MQIVAKPWNITLWFTSAPCRHDVYIGWCSPSWTFKRSWWFFRLRLVNGFGLTILGFQISWWKRSKPRG